MSTLPDPNVTGPCQLQANLFCTGQGVERMNPMDMIARDSAFSRYMLICQPCYDTQADLYVATTAGRL